MADVKMDDSMEYDQRPTYVQGTFAQADNTGEEDSFDAVNEGLANIVRPRNEPETMETKLQRHAKRVEDKCRAWWEEFEFKPKEGVANRLFEQLEDCQEEERALLQEFDIAKHGLAAIIEQLKTTDNSTTWSAEHAHIEWRNMLKQLRVIEHMTIVDSNQFKALNDWHTQMLIDLLNTMDRFLAITLDRMDKLLKDAQQKPPPADYLNQLAANMRALMNGMREHVKQVRDGPLLLWHRQQKKAMLGIGVTNSGDQDLAENSEESMVQDQMMNEASRRFSALLAKWRRAIAGLPIIQTHAPQLYETFKTELESLLPEILQRSFVIEWKYKKLRQPPLVLANGKVNSDLTIRSRILALVDDHQYHGNELQMDSPQYNFQFMQGVGNDGEVTESISEGFALQLRNNEVMQPNPRYPQFPEALEEAGVLGSGKGKSAGRGNWQSQNRTDCLKNFTVSLNHDKSRMACTKFFIKVTAQIALVCCRTKGAVVMTLSTISTPFMVHVGPKEQECKILEGFMYDVQACDPDSITCQPTPDPIPMVYWSDYAKGLQAHAYKYTSSRPLRDDELHGFAQRIYKTGTPPPNNAMLHRRFGEHVKIASKTQIRGLKNQFFTYYIKGLDIVMSKGSSKVEDAKTERKRAAKGQTREEITITELFRNGVIFGFASQTRVAEVLKKATKSAMIIRFSEHFPGYLSFSYVIKHVLRELVNVKNIDFIAVGYDLVTQEVTLTPKKDVVEKAAKGYGVECDAEVKPYYYNKTNVQGARLTFSPNVGASREQIMEMIMNDPKIMNDVRAKVGNEANNSRPSSGSQTPSDAWLSQAVGLLSPDFNMQAGAQSPTFGGAHMMQPNMPPAQQMPGWGAPPAGLDHGLIAQQGSQMQFSPSTPPLFGRQPQGFIAQNANWQHPASGGFQQQHQQYNMMPYQQQQPQQQWGAEQYPQQQAVFMGQQQPMQYHQMANSQYVGNYQVPPQNQPSQVQQFPMHHSQPARFEQQQPVQMAQVSQHQSLAYQAPNPAAYQAPNPQQFAITTVIPQQMAMQSSGGMMFNMSGAHHQTLPTASMMRMQQASTSRRAFAHDSPTEQEEDMSGTSGTE